MKVLLTGATGRIGREIISARPESITVESLLEPFDQNPPESPWFRVDILDRDKLMMAVGCSDPDYIIHCAAMTDVDGCERNPELARSINVTGSANVAEAARECGAGMVYLSTDYVFDGEKGPYDEIDTPNPVNIYGRTKHEGEKVVINALERSLILRISVPFGRRRAGTGHNFISWLAEQLTAVNEVRIVRDQFTTPAFMIELAETIWHLIGHKITGTLHFGTADRLSRVEMAYILADVLAVPRDLITEVTSSEIGFDARRPLESGFVTERLHEILGHPTMHFKTALYAMIESGALF